MKDGQWQHSYIYRNMHKDFTYSLPEHLSPVTLTKHLLTNPFECYGGLFFFPSSPSHHRCIEIQSLLWTQWVWGELPEEIRTGGSWRELSSDHFCFSCSVCFHHTLAKLVITVTQPISPWPPWSHRHTCRSATNTDKLMRETVSFAISMCNLPCGIKADNPRNQKCHLQRIYVWGCVDITGWT